MLSSKDFFNGMRLVKAIGIKEIDEIKSKSQEIGKSEKTEEQKIEEASMMMMDFLLKSVCDAEVELKKLLAGWKGISFKEIDETSADEFMNIVEEFANKNTVKELTTFFGRVLSLISTMR